MPTAHSLPAIVDVQTVAALLEQNAPLKIIDVRTLTEFETVHIPGSYNVPLDALPPSSCAGAAPARARPRGYCGPPTSNRSTSSMAASRPGRRRARPCGAAQSAGHWKRQVRGAAGSLVLLGILGGLRAWKPLTYLAAVVGAGLTYSAVSDSYAMGMVLSKLPYNQGARDDVRAALA